MSKEDMTLRLAMDQLLSINDESNWGTLQELIKSRSLSTLMEALNQQLLDGTPSEKERARIAIEQLGFAAD